MGVASLGNFCHGNRQVAVHSPAECAVYLKEVLVLVLEFRILNFRSLSLYVYNFMARSLLGCYSDC